MASTKSKKQRLAPLKKAKNDSPEQVSKNDEFQFTDDILDEIFNDADLKEPPAPKDKNQTMPVKHIDLDDWIPKDLLSMPTSTPVPKEKISPPPEDKVIAKIPKAPTYASRKEMLFSSVEFEADTTLGLRFTKRRVPATRLKEWTAPFKKVTLFNALNFSESKDWYTFGVVSEYGEIRKGGSGKMDVTDLAPEPYIIRFMLFGSAFSDMGAVPVGSIVCISRPKKGKPFNGRESLIINNADQVLVAGTSRDFGLCSGKKKTGGACRAVVNMDNCRYCKFHAMAEYKDKKMAVDMKAAAAGVGLGFKTPSTAGLWNAQANQARFLNPAKKNITMIKKDMDTLNKLNSSPSSQPRPETSRQPRQELTENRSSFGSRSVFPAEKRKLECPQDISPPHQKKPLLEVKNTPASTSSTSPSPRLSAAKRKALQYVRENGSITQNKPKEICQPFKEEVVEKPKGITDEFLALMREKPRDEKLLEGAEAQERDKKFERLQIVEEVGEKLAATHEVPVRAIRCLVCNKNYHALPMQCVLSKHGCKVVTGVKRYFECTGCKTRTTTLERMPAAECSKCGAWNWKRAGVAPNKVCNVAPQLAIRGLEEKFVNSVVKDPNLNLLMPDES